ncbi:M48 family metallopeptidase [Sphingomonas sp. AX6]|uniref:M48 family metallopeptidase n=1 Tax=Sphingomonas sp. AX6 TaxID=2653171 RepID=UPI0012EF9EF7|nr:M48 family metallopeptidase [Sphingomonas sp. AX6]VXC50369.1 M48 family peptidase [Sphingomonas sp. AX6]
MSEAPEITVVRNPRSRGAKLSVDRVTGEIRLTIPPRASARSALAWAQGQQAWIAAQQSKLPCAQPIRDGSLLTVDSVPLTARMVDGGPRTPQIEDGALICTGPEALFQARILRWLRREALRLLSVDTAEFAGRAGVVVSGVSVGDPRGRWGSCSSTGAIRYSWRLVLSPAWVRRAIVAHEVAHRVHMNHGREFRALEAELSHGKAVLARAWLRGNGVALHWVGRE